MKHEEIIEKQKELIDMLMCSHIDWMEVDLLQGELQSLQEQEKEPSVNFMQIRELTDEEWMKLPKEEILRLYKNCYSMLQNYIKLSGENIPEVKTVTSTNFESVDQSGIREELIKYACRNDKYQTTNIRNTEVPAFLEMLRKEHERSVDEYLKSKQ